VQLQLLQLHRTRLRLNLSFRLRIYVAPHNLRGRSPGAPVTNIRESEMRIVEKATATFASIAAQFIIIAAVLV
jgi:hypothetical protein